MILRLLIICSLFKEKFLVRYDAVTQQTGEKTLGHWLGHLEHVFGHILGLFEHILTNHINRATFTKESEHEVWVTSSPLPEDSGGFDGFEAGAHFLFSL